MTKCVVAILHNIRSMHNVGSIFRTADAVGIEKIYLCGITPAPIDKFGRKRQQITKVSLGAENYIAWEHTKSTTRLIDELKKDGYTILAIEQSKKAIPYYEFQLMSTRHPELVSGSYQKSGDNDYEMPKQVENKFSASKRHDKKIKGTKKKTALILGNEIKGLPSSILNRADKILEIPMKGKKESLNVAVAFGIVAFHFSHHLSYPKRKKA